MKKAKFRIGFLEKADAFLDSLPEKHRAKIIYNIDLASRKNNSNLFKKLEDDIWYFRTIYSGKLYRLFAFWDKRSDMDTLVIATHGIVKKSQKVSKTEIEKAKHMRKEYFKSKT